MNDKEKIEELKIDIRILKLNMWFYIIIYACIIGLTAFIFGYLLGILDVVSIYEITEVKEALNLTNIVNDSTLLELNYN